MGKNPENLEMLKQGNCKQMSDVATANFLVEQIGGKRRVSDMIYSAARELNKRFPHRQDPENKWTERRLRGWWNNESRVVKHFQMMELYEAAEQLRKARQDHADFIEKTARIRSLAQLAASNGLGGMAED
ncbi:hypothetical protein N5K21_28735 [Rhizobium pusense]|uniref:hypothetical protein n=1 Tax=Agrobacterium pusense TaxID=648995 RepID=UPI002448AC41|nr:hypothetical protein [Agrobacterium pusense]MDH2092686.1 hypothetical protein [Agrobacterium pusense]